MGVYVTATLLLVLRAALVRRQRFAWSMLAVGLTSYTSATCYSWIVTGGVTALPFPSPADAGWLLFYPFAYIGLLALIRAQVPCPRTRTLLDGATAGLGAAAVLSALSIETLIKSSDADRLLTTLTGFAYPVSDALLLGMVLCLFVVGGSVGRKNLALLTASLLAFTVADTGYVALASRGNYHPGDLVDTAYLIALTLIGLSAWQHERSVSGNKNETVPLAFPIMFALSSLALLLAATTTTISSIPVTFAGATLVFVVMRTLVSFRQIKTMALHDALTGLPNRALIMDRMEQLLVRNRRNGTRGAVLYIDLDGFKNVNDRLGHDAGDQLLRAVAARLTTSLRDADTIGRMGGDEFVVLVDGMSLMVAPELVAERILEVMRQPFALDLAAQPILVTTSVGIAAGDRDTAGDLLRDADIALYRAKTAGKNCSEVFRPDMETDVQQQYELEFDLRTALENNEFRLMYQPIYNLADLTLVGVEALIRWEHPTRGQIQPDDFIPALEASGHIVEVGRWVLMEACRQMKTWNDLGSDLTMSVNVSGRQLDRDSIVEHVAEALIISQLDPARLTVEITETALMKDTGMTARRLQGLKTLGVQLAIDDFGTGYSSLAYLQKFPVDCLKIDRSFTDALTRSSESNALVHTLVQLGKDLGLKTLAEGVETSGQLEHLRGEAVNEAQGFLLSRPLTAEAVGIELLAFLTSSHLDGVST